MKPPPEQLDNADVLLWACSEVEPFGSIHDSSGAVALILGLAICRYSDSTDIYRFSCNSAWEVVQDAHYQSIEEAKEAAARLFSPLLIGTCLIPRRRRIENVPTPPCKGSAIDIAVSLAGVFPRL